MGREQGGCPMYGRFQNPDSWPGNCSQLRGLSHMCLHIFCTRNGLNYGNASFLSHKDLTSLDK